MGKVPRVLHTYFGPDASTPDFGRWRRGLLHAGACTQLRGRHCGMHAELSSQGSAQSLSERTKEFTYQLFPHGWVWKKKG